MQNKKYLSVLASGAVLAALITAAPALADTNNNPQTPNTQDGQGGWGRGMGMMPGGVRRAPGVLGTVASVSGNTITVTSTFGPHAKGANSTPTTYTVDATNAKVIKAGTTSSVSAIVVGDTVMVQGTVSGTNTITATTIREMPPQAGGMMGRKPEGTEGPNGTKMPPNSIITGNGQPIVGGAVTAISGSTLTITNKSNVTYTVNAAGAVIEKGNATSTIANIAVGDTVVVQGAVNGNAITASSVLDQGTAPAANTANNADQPKPRGMMGIFAGIGGFFGHLFGF